MRRLMRAAAMALVLATAVMALVTGAAAQAGNAEVECIAAVPVGR